MHSHNVRLANQKRLRRSRLCGFILPGDCQPQCPACQVSFHRGDAPLGSVSHTTVFAVGIFAIKTSGSLSGGKTHAIVLVVVVLLMN